MHNSKETIYGKNLIGSHEITESHWKQYADIENYSAYFNQASAPLEEIARANPNTIPLLKLARKGFEDMCHKILGEDRLKYTEATETIKKLKQEVQLLKRENDVIKKEKENFEREAARNYSMYKKMKEDNKELQKVAKNYEKTIKKLDLDEYNLTSDDLRSECNKRYQKGIDAKGHPLVPRLDFEKIHQLREQQELEDAQDDMLEEEEEEEELLTENEKYMFKGSELQSHQSLDRKQELERRKEDIIAVLNKTYADEEGDNDIKFEDFKEDEVLFHDIQGFSQL